MSQKNFQLDKILGAIHCEHDPKKCSAYCGRVDAYICCTFCEEFFVCEEICLTFRGDLYGIEGS
jgi:hypothetical protein